MTESWEARMAARARERREAVERAALAEAVAEDAVARTAEQEAVLGMAPPPCPKCWLVEFSGEPLFRPTAGGPVTPPRTPFWDHFPSGEAVNDEGWAMWVCDCDCHPERQMWGPIIGLAGAS